VAAITLALAATVAAPVMIAVTMTPAAMVVMMMVMVVMTVVILAMTPFAVAITVRSGIGSALRPRACRQAEQPHAQNQLMCFV
jgi:hypothetical protein